jgi:hypothetical protein
MNAARTARDLCRDAFGNGTSGQEERSMRYIALAIEQLECLMHTLEDRSDSRRTVALEKLTRSLREDTHPAYKDFPAFDGERMGEFVAKWKARNLPDVLPKLSKEQMPQALRDAIEAGEPGMPLRIVVPTDQLSELFRR